MRGVATSFALSPFENMKFYSFWNKFEPRTAREVKAASYRKVLMLFYRNTVFFQQCLKEYLRNDEREHRTIQ
jgi:hypothetical protein